MVVSQKQVECSFMVRNRKVDWGVGVGGGGTLDQHAARDIFQPLSHLNLMFLFCLCLSFVHVSLGFLFCFLYKQFKFEHSVAEEFFF